MHIIPRINFICKTGIVQQKNLPDIEKALLEKACIIDIKEASWSAFPYTPGVCCRIAFDENHLYLRYEVREQAVLAINTKPNDPVCQDSCVEFFFIPPGADSYINFESNCIGTVLLGNGKERSGRIPADPAVIHSILIQSTLGTTPFSEKKGDFSWSLTAVIPISVYMPGQTNKSGGIYKANFYKCGDNLTVPHYVSWNRINTPEPDFHRPEFFAPLQLA